ncbi:uncharacterized protein LOC115943198 isoform X3 [Leptonychotes weddellii]|uniref:Uncharacterized protein LOC115943198 isoform X3 n=1 Tax=Leptonychotes weddellii TaxID=9713 RepID=A0A7F8RCV1_LEPWE|nr:uncharacterized protein LOC115943198 isoform X3 [Leptonychotes weddellii]
MPLPLARPRGRPVAVQVGKAAVGGRASCAASASPPPPGPSRWGRGRARCTCGHTARVFGSRLSGCLSVENIANVEQNESPSGQAHLSHQPLWAQHPRFVDSGLCHCCSKCRSARRRVCTGMGVFCITAHTVKKCTSWGPAAGPSNVQEGPRSLPAVHMTNNHDTGLLHLHEKAPWEERGGRQYQSRGSPRRWLQSHTFSTYSRRKNTERRSKTRKQQEGAVNRVLGGRTQTDRQ